MKLTALEVKWGLMNWQLTIRFNLQLRVVLIDARIFGKAMAAACVSRSVAVLRKATFRMVVVV
jgi:hypothetical protein